MNIAEKIRSWNVGAGKVGIVWLAQAGFLFKTPEGRILMLDPYLSDYVYRLTGDKAYIRLSQPVFEPGELKADCLLLSHEHPDHTDADAFEGITHGNTIVIGNPESLELLRQEGHHPADYRQIAAGEEFEIFGIRIRAVLSDHGGAVPHALGFLLHFGNTCVYYSGDTAYSPEMLGEAVHESPAIALLPINGAYGNMNAIEAALLARDLKARVCIPHHIWTFPDHNAENGDPKTALRYFPAIAPQCKLRLATPGELMEF